MAGDWDITELNTLAANLALPGARVGALAATVVRKVAADVERDAKVFAPVDTGNLRGSISSTTTGDGRGAGISAEIGPTAAYGVYVEFGTSRHGPAAFMGPALDRHGPAFIQAIGIVAQRALDGAL